MVQNFKVKQVRKLDLEEIQVCRVIRLDKLGNQYVIGRWRVAGIVGNNNGK